MWDVIINSLPNFSGWSLFVKGIVIYPTFHIGCDYLSMLGLKLQFRWHSRALLYIWSWIHKTWNATINVLDIKCYPRTKFRKICSLIFHWSTPDSCKISYHDTLLLIPLTESWVCWTDYMFREMIYYIMWSLCFYSFLGCRSNQENGTSQRIRIFICRWWRHQMETFSA